MAVRSGPSSPVLAGPIILKVSNDHTVVTRKLNLFLRKSIKLLPPELLLWPRYAPNRLSAGASPQTPLGELTALAQTP